MVDDHYMVIEGVKSLLQNEANISWVGHASSSESCLAFLKLHEPDVILMDINLGEESGIELCEIVRKTYPNIKVLGLSTFNQQSFIQKIIDKGASGYLLKNATRKELTDAIFTVMAGKTYLSAEASQVLRKSDDSNILLTRREKEILELIADGLTNNEIATKLFVSVTTIDTHRKNLLAKFQAKNIASLVKTAIRQNLI